MPDGSVFVINNKDAELSTASMPIDKTRQGLPNSSASKHSIHQNDPFVNSSAKKDAEYLSEVENPDIRYNLDTTNTAKPKAKAKTKAEAEKRDEVVAEVVGETKYELATPNQEILLCCASSS